MPKGVTPIAIARMPIARARSAGAIAPAISADCIEPNAPEQQAALAPVHRVTSSIYAALESWIAGDPAFAQADVSPRQLAVATHMSAVGLVTMFALADALGDPLVHSFDKMVEAMVALHRRGDHWPVGRSVSFLLGGLGSLGIATLSVLGTFAASSRPICTR